jgi:hypothetical protein
MGKIIIDIIMYAFDVMLVSKLAFFTWVVSKGREKLVKLKVMNTSPFNST